MNHACEEIYPSDERRYWPERAMELCHGRREPMPAKRFYKIG